MVICDEWIIGLFSVRLCKREMNVKRLVALANFLTLVDRN